MTKRSNKTKNHAIFFPCSSKAHQHTLLINKSFICTTTDSTDSDDPIKSQQWLAWLGLVHPPPPPRWKRTALRNVLKSAKKTQVTKKQRWFVSRMFEHCFYWLRSHYFNRYIGFFTRWFSNDKTMFQPPSFIVLRVQLVVTKFLGLWQKQNAASSREARRRINLMAFSLHSASLWTPTPEAFVTTAAPLVTLAARTALLPRVRPLFVCVFRETFCRCTAWFHSKT